MILNLIYVILFFSILLTKFQINQEYAYRFLKFAIERGFSFKNDKYIESFGELEKNIINYRLYAYILISILILLFMLKRAFFGGFKYKILHWIFFLVSILFILYNLVNLILAIIIEVYSWIYIDVFEKRIKFNDDTFIAKLAVQACLNTLIFVIQIILFLKSIGYTIFMYSVKSENDKLVRQNQEVNNNSKGKKEEGFEFVGLDMKPYYFQPINNTALPKNLLYVRTENKKRTIFIPENVNLIQQSGIDIFNGYSGKNNNIKNIKNDLDIKSNLSEEQRLKNKKDNNNNNNYHQIKKNIREEEITKTDISSIKNNNVDKYNDSNELIILNNENEKLKKENEKLKQKIQKIKNKNKKEMKKKTKQ